MTWPMKRIRLTDQFMITFGGEEGFDAMMGFVFPHKPFYYTFEILMPFDISTESVPFNLHRTAPGQLKTHEPILFGSFNVSSFIRSLPRYTPTVQQVDLATIESDRVFLLDNFMPKLYKKEVRVTPDFVSSLSYSTGQQLSKTDFRVAVATSGTTPSLILNTPGGAYSLGLPNFKSFESTLEKSMTYSFEPNAKEIVRSDLKQLKLRL
ncbi:MAG: hypothetical protein KGI38_08930 [Thaumarchaeota archaeon]|nr:hypothetical protein [Nitrososphaerota archaeon]